ncbi:MAG: hypothetical protein OWS74_00450 [Firmicutes bacterium]|nr:hypothetical protein [Bacillota bacterium]
MLVDRTFVRVIGIVAIVGGLIFFGVNVPSVGYYLIGSGLIFLLSTWGWKKRYENVLEAPPEGFSPTGEIYINPGSTGPVEVWHKGIRRVYVAYHGQGGAQH